MTSRFATMNSATACHTGAHPADVARGSTSPGASGSALPSTSSEARALAIVTRSPSSTAITPVATLASTRAVRSRASSSAAWLRRTSVAMRSNAVSTGSNSRGVPGGNAGGSLPRPTAIAASRNAATGLPRRRAAKPARYTAANKPVTVARTRASARSSCCCCTLSSSSSRGTASTACSPGTPGPTTR